MFRAWPYLYDGDLEYERKYLQSYRDSDRAIVVGAFDGDQPDWRFNRCAAD